MHATTLAALPFEKLSKLLCVGHVMHCLPGKVRGKHEINRFKLCLQGIGMPQRM